MFLSYEFQYKDSKTVGNFTAYSACSESFLYRHSFTHNFLHFGSFKSLFSKKADPLLLLMEKEQREGPDRLIEKDRLINWPVKLN